MKLRLELELVSLAFEQSQMCTFCCVRRRLTRIIESTRTDKRARLCESLQLLFSAQTRTRVAGHYEANINENF